MENKTESKTYTEVRNEVVRMSLDEKDERARQQLIHIARMLGEAHGDGSTSDGYHTFDELYRYRMLYNAAFFNMLAKEGKVQVCKSKVHSDGQPCFGGGWFIVVATLPDVGQISNHYEECYWGMFNIPEAVPPEYDGHTPKQAVTRLQSWLAAEYISDLYVKGEMEDRLAAGKKTETPE
jgi:hypothetical protein